MYTVRIWDIPTIRALVLFKALIMRMTILLCPLSSHGKRAFSRGNAPWSWRIPHSAACLALLSWDSYNCSEQFCGPCSFSLLARTTPIKSFQRSRCSQRCCNLDNCLGGMRYRPRLNARNADATLKAYHKAFQREQFHYRANFLCIS